MRSVQSKHGWPLGHRHTQTHVCNCPFPTVPTPMLSLCWVPLPHAPPLSNLQTPGLWITWGPTSPWPSLCRFDPISLLCPQDVATCVLHPLTTRVTCLATVAQGRHSWCTKWADPHCWGECHTSLSAVTDRSSSHGAMVSPREQDQDYMGEESCPLPGLCQPRFPGAGGPHCTHTCRLSF